jgi:hypothetical protein
MVWVAPWAGGILKSGSMRSLELDAGSWASTPHAYIIPLAVIANYWIPPGLSLPRGKRMELYKLFSNCFFDMNPSHIKAFE